MNLTITADQANLLRSILASYDNQRPVMCLGDAVGRLIKEKEERGLRCKYVKGLRQHLTNFVNDLGPAVDVRSITVEMVQAWLTKRGYDKNAHTRASHLGRLSGLFQSLWRGRYVDENIINRIEKPLKTFTAPQVLTPEQFETLLLYAQIEKPHFLAYLILTGFCGLRPTETEGVHWQDVRLHGSEPHIVVDAAASKVRRRRIVPMQPVAVEWMHVAAQLHSKLPCPRGCQKWWAKRLRARIGMERWPNDFLRHSAASYLLGLHKDAGKVAFMLGNSPSILMRHYSQIVCAADVERWWGLRPTHSEVNGS